MSEPHVVAKGGGARLDAVRWPVHTERLALRPAEAADAEATWRFRQLDEVTRWLTGRSASLDEHRLTFMDPDRLSKTLVAELDGEVIADLVLEHKDGFSQRDVADAAGGGSAVRSRQHDGRNRCRTGRPASRPEHRLAFMAPDRLSKTLVVGRDGEWIAALMLEIKDGFSQRDVAEGARGVEAELGWVFDPAHTGHGYATEAVRELLRLSFEELGLRRVIANCFAENEASWRLMERVGMRRETHTIRQALHRPGEWLDGLGYAILADEWQAAAGR